jgi:hypothetical protein
MVEFGHHENWLRTGRRTDMNNPVEYERKVAEDYRRHLQEIEARQSGLVTMTKSEFIAWAEANNDELIAIASARGVLPEDAPAAVAEYLEMVRAAPELGKFDDVNVYLIMRRVLAEIEDACRILKIPTRGGVVFGASPILGQRPQQSPVSLAEGFSIVNVSMSFLPFCDLISAVLAHTLVCDPLQQSISNDPDEVKARLAANPQIVDRWARIIVFCAIYDLHPPKEDLPLSDMEKYAYGCLLRAIEIFALGHEYGHHILDGLHESIEDKSDPIADEHGADFIGQGISKVIGGRERPPNEYAISGVGAVVILGALQLVLRAKSMLEMGHDMLPTSTSHPTFADRIEVIGTVHANEPTDLQAAFQQRRANFVEVLEIVWTRLRPHLKSLHEAGIRPRPYVSPKQGWRPLTQNLAG